MDGPQKNLAVNADGSAIAIADSRHGAITLLRTEDGSMSRISGEATVALDRMTYAAAIAFDDQGRLLVGRLDDRVDVIDPTTASVTARLAMPDDSAHVAMAADPSGLVVASGDRHLVAFDPRDGVVRWSTDIARPYLAPCNWLTVAAAVGNHPGEVISYEPVADWVVGCGAAFWNLTKAPREATAPGAAAAR